jgi:hypothetical protein
MGPVALSVAVVLGAASFAAGEAGAAPVVAAGVTIESSRTVLVGGKRHHHRHGFHRGLHSHKSFKRHQSFAHKGFKRHQSFAKHHHGFHHRGFARQRVFVAKPIGKGQFVLIRPTYGRTLRQYRLLSPPLIKHGRFVRGPYHW